MSYDNSDTFDSIIERYISRRRLITGLASAATVSAFTACDSSVSSDRQINAHVENPASLGFKEVGQQITDRLQVPEGYQAQVVIRWGDAITEGLPSFDPKAQSLSEQQQRFGFNNDFVGYIPLPLGSRSADHGLLVVNHEYTSPEMMFFEEPQEDKLSRAQADIDIAAHGLSVIEIRRTNSTWQVNKSSKYSRRITPLTPVELTGPAAGSDRLKTIISKDGVHSLGTYGNCAGGVTPWGTILTGEENVDGYFSGDYRLTAEAENYERFGMFKSYKNWGEHYPRWHLNKNPNELLHMGWIVEIDPLDPESKPKKRTALGRFKHEGCNVYINSDQHVVAYTGDDQKFEYIYKFVSRGKYRADDREHNMELLADGTLYVAKFNDDATLNWLPLVYGHAGLGKENKFFSQADICLDTRKAADIVGATKMDRPEDVEVNPVNGRVYAMLTNNNKRKSKQTDKANPRANNGHGQIIEFWPANGDHSRTDFSWDLFLLAGKPGVVASKYHPGISSKGWLSCPDNCTFDRLGNLWIGSDGAQKYDIADGVWACEVSGDHKALTKRFLSVPIGAELCGPYFTPDDTTFFVAIQHPGADSSFNSPSTRWPDFDASMPPRPAVVAITKKNGGRVGS